MVAKKRPLPLNKQFPNQWSTRTVFYTPKGSRIEIGGPLPTETAQLAFHLMCLPKLTPKLQSKLQSFYDDLVAMTNKKTSTVETLVTSTE